MLHVWVVAGGNRGTFTGCASTGAQHKRSPSDRIGATLYVRVLEPIAKLPRTPNDDAVENENRKYTPETHTLVPATRADYSASEQ